MSDAVRVVTEEVITEVEKVVTEEVITEVEKYEITLTREQAVMMVHLLGRVSATSNVCYGIYESLDAILHPPYPSKTVLTDPGGDGISIIFYDPQEA